MSPIYDPRRLDARNDQGIRDALAGEQPIPKLVTVCAYCPDHWDRTVAARAHGFDVTHQICEPCNARLNAAIDAVKAQREDPCR